MRHLKDIVFIERLQEPDRPRRYRFRMVGRDQIRSGSDVTGKYLDEVILPPFVASWYAAYDMALDIAGPVRFVSHLQSLGLDHMTAETLITPARRRGRRALGPADLHDLRAAHRVARANRL